jgi:hypothetical protein
MSIKMAVHHIQFNVYLLSKMCSLNLTPSGLEDYIKILSSEGKPYSMIIKECKKYGWLTNKYKICTIVNCVGKKRRKAAGLDVSARKPHPLKS